MSRLKSLYYHICSALPTRALLKLNKSGTLFPYHHVVSDEWIPHISNLYSYKNRKEFNEDLDELLKYLRPISVEDIAEAVKHGRELPANSFLLTFDDGFKEIHEIVAPILKAKGLPAIFFINPAFVDNKKFFYRCKISLLLEELKRIENDKDELRKFSTGMNWNFTTMPEIEASLKKFKTEDEPDLEKASALLNFSYSAYFEKAKPFLSSGQIAALKKDGFTVGAHSWDHPYFQSITEAQQLEQVSKSVTFVKDHFNETTLTFSFPHSDEGLPQDLFNEILKLSVEPDLIFGIQNQKCELQNRVLHRFNAERPETPMSRQLNGILMAILLRKMSGKNQVKRN
ncbi:MAG: hypothetical protein C5B52_13210 [Bacteroidetes bacterium]|nr:MAG: hypothetical protein C5B52_13210 [Bacteroidota bacterium]